MFKDNRGRQCLTCNHERRAEIELRIASGTPIKAIAAKYGLKPDSLRRHKLRHMDATLIQGLQAAGKRINPAELQALKESESDGLLQNLVHERARQQRIADKAEALDDFANATRASVAALKSSELIAKLLGDIQTGNLTQNILVAPEFMAFRVAIIESLRPYPAAKLAVLHSMQRLEAQEAEDVITHTTGA